MEQVAKRCQDDEQCASFDCSCFTGTQKRQAFILQMCAYDAALAAAPAVIQCDSLASRAWAGRAPRHALVERHMRTQRQPMPVKKPKETKTQYGPILTRRRNARGTLKRKL